MKFNLYPFQQIAVEKNLASLDANGASLEATGCGGGKTIIACEVARRYGLPVGVICPKSVKAKWAATLEAFGIEPVFVENPEKLRAGNTPWVKKAGKGFKWTPESLLLVVDEVHCFAGYKSTNSKMLEDSPYRTLMLSATAAESPLRMKVIGAKLGLFHPRAFWGWVRNMGVYVGCDRAWSAAMTAKTKPRASCAKSKPSASKAVVSSSVKSSKRPTRL